MAASSSPTYEFINSRSEEFINYLFLTDHAYEMRAILAESCFEET